MPRDPTTRSARSAAVSARSGVAGSVIGLAPSSRSTSSRIAAAISSFGAFGTWRLAVAGDEHDLVVGAVEADVVPPHVVVDDEIDVLVVEHRPLALETGVAVLGAERDEHLAGVRLAPSALTMSPVGTSSTSHGSPSFGRLPSMRSAGR